MTTEIQKFNAEVTKELANAETLKTLLATTFKGLSPESMKQAIVEGMIRGFNFQDFMQKNVYAIPYGSTYSLVTSIDYARKVGMRSGVVGKTEPIFEEVKEGAEKGKIISCSVTIKRKVQGEIGEFSSKVYFSEYTSGQNLWAKKPRTMIAKVAEMHALRMACPEEMSQVYVEEEFEKTETPGKLAPIDVDEYAKKLKTAKNHDELKALWSAIPMEAKTKLESLKNDIKATFK